MIRPKIGKIFFTLPYLMKNRLYLQNCKNKVFMKRVLLVLLSFSYTYSFAQQFVSTTPAKKNVILEQYTGVTCEACPEGHRIADQLTRQYPERFFTINIHHGGYSVPSPSYAVSYSNALASQAAVANYPSGTINRRIFLGNATALGRNLWGNSANDVLNENSPVNIAAQSTIDFQNRKLTVTVEAYYTANAPGNKNYLNIALLQNDVLGYQAGGFRFYPEYALTDALYCHTHMLRSLITGQWGEEITTVTQGTLYRKTFTYTIPKEYEGVPFALENAEIIVFITENHQNIINGAKSAVAAMNTEAIVPKITALQERFYPTCDSAAGINVFIKNAGKDPFYSLRFKYSATGDVFYTYEWNARTIPSLSSDTIHLPAFNMPVNTDNLVFAEVSAVNGVEIHSQPIVTVNMQKNMVSTGGSNTLEFATDQFASENSFVFFKPDNTVFMQEGLWGDLTVPGVTVREFEFNPPQNGCFRLEVEDRVGDGMRGIYGDGYFKLINNKTERTIFHHDGDFQFLVRVMIAVDSFNVRVSDWAKTDFIELYPNPTTDFLNIKAEHIEQVDIYNLQGQLLMTTQNENPQIPVFNLSKGIYFVQVRAAGKGYTGKFVKQ